MAKPLIGSFLSMCREAIGTVNGTTAEPAAGGRSGLVDEAGY
jgi:hypothetical protein